MGIAAICAAALCTHYFYFLLSSLLLLFMHYLYPRGKCTTTLMNFKFCLAHCVLSERFLLFSLVPLCPTGWVARVWLNFPSRFIENERAFSFRTMGGENWKAYTIWLRGAPDHPECSCLIFVLSCKFAQWGPLPSCRHAVCSYVK